MKNILFAISAVALLSSCATVKIRDTQVASGATDPSAIYVQPFDVSATEWRGYHPGGHGQDLIRQSLAGTEFARDLKLELEKIAPARVLRPGEVAPGGWLVEGSLEVVHAGHPVGRFLSPWNHLGLGRSHVVIHVRISQVGTAFVGSDKDAGKLGQRGHVLYEFDLEGGSRATGKLGSITAPGLGYSVPFDFKIAAERVYSALSIDPLKYGTRMSPTIR